MKINIKAFLKITGGSCIEEMKDQVYPDLQVYAPPDPDVEELYIPPLDDLDYLGVLPFYASLLPPKKRKERSDEAVKLDDTNLQV